jgi:pyruvate ferredoxin oxidoreductase alpha subunit
MREFLEGSEAVALAVKLSRPGVIAAYPITPQTHIPEKLARLVADGELKSEFVNVESEHSAASVVLGAVATGVRAYTATSSQGLLYMGEVVFNIAGLRLPVVMTCANRAVSAPINIWNDLQDSIAMRDSGWIQFYAEDNQEALDLHLIAYRIAEDKNIMLPVMVCMDGYLLTHGLETVDMPEQEKVDKFLPSYEPLYKLDPQNPLTLGFLADPDYYLETRFAIQETHKDVLKLIPQVLDDFQKVFGRRPSGLLEEYKTKDADKVIVTMGSLCGTVKDVVDELRAKGRKVGLVKITTFRPFPSELIYRALKDIPRVAILDKAISLGGWGPLCTEIKALFAGKKNAPSLSGFVLGLGGRDVTPQTIKVIFKKLTGPPKACEFIDLKSELLQDRYE